MRDEKERHNPVVYSIKTERIPADPTFTPFTTSHPGDCLVKKSARADLIHSNGKTPTPYWAYDVNISPNSFKLQKWGRTGTSYWRDANGALQSVDWQELKTAEGSMEIEPRAVSFMGVNSSTFRPQVDPWIINKANNSVLKKLKRQEADLGATFGEVNELRGLIIKRIIGTVRMLLQVIRGRVPPEWRRFNNRLRGKGGRRYKPSDGLAYIAELWLELKLGWLPLFSEMFSFQEAIKKVLIDEDDLILRVTSVAKGRNNPWYYLGHHFDGSSIQGSQAGYLGKPELTWANDLDRLGAGNPAAIAWDLLPLSFTIDWLVKIGDFLNLLTATSGIDFLGGYNTTWSRGSGTVTRTAWTPDGSPGWVGTQPSWSIDCFTMLRDLKGDFPHATMQLGTGLNSAHRASIGAALVALSRIR